ncbi:MAG: AAA family ATPase [Novosphingobium sp.]
MTDQSKIPLPEDGDDGMGGAAEKSLLERATRSFDLKGFAPAPMPEKLAAASKPRARTLASQRPPQTAVAAPAPADPAPVATPEPASISSEPQAVEFKSARQAIKRDRLREEGMIVPDGPVTGLVEEFRIVKREILRGMAALTSAGMGMNGASQRILISSPHSGEGKTFCAINLAFSLAAERDAEVVLVDADFARPSILSRLGLKGAAGLMDALADPSANVEDFVIGTDVEGLWVLPSGNRTNADSEYLASARAAAVLGRLTQGAPNRIVIFDSPPALAASPAAELARHVGQTLVVVQADETGRSALEDAVSLLSACPDVKLLLNAARFSPSGRTFGSYYGYGG